MTDVMEEGSRFLRDLGSAANRNPLSAALIGMGVLWLFAGRTGARKVGAMLGRASDMAGDMAGQSLDSAGSAISSGASTARRAMSASAETAQRRGSETWYAASHAGREQMQALSEYSPSIPEKGAGQFEDFGNSLTDLFRRQPLAVGAIGAAIGAGIAAALPLTETETAYLGEAGEAVKERAGRVMDAAAEEARKQGLTMEGIKSAANEMTAKAGHVVDAAKEGVAERANATQ